MDPEKKVSTQARPNISSRSIKLTHTDPIKRLKEFCKAGKYYHHIKWDKFANGFMFECEVVYNLGRYGHNRRRVLVKEVRWVETDNLIEGQRVIAAILLDNLGLGVPDDGECEGEEEIEDISQDFTKAVTGVLNQVSQQLDNEEGDKDPLLSMAGGLIKQMTTMMNQEDIQEEEVCKETSQETNSTDIRPPGLSAPHVCQGDQKTKPTDSWADMCQAQIPIGSWGDICQGIQETKLRESWGDMCQEPGKCIKSWSDIASEPK